MQAPWLVTSAVLVECYREPRSHRTCHIDVHVTRCCSFKSLVYTFFKRSLTTSGISNTFWTNTYHVQNTRTMIIDEHGSAMGCGKARNSENYSALLSRLFWSLLRRLRCQQGQACDVRWLKNERARVTRASFKFWEWKGLAHCVPLIPLWSLTRLMLHEV